MPAIRHLKEIQEKRKEETIFLRKNEKEKEKENKKKKKRKGKSKKRKRGLREVPPETAEKMIF